MIIGWLAKIAITILLLGFAVVELGSPLLTRAQLDGVAHEAADEAGHEVMQSHDTNQARTEAEQVAARAEAALTTFEVDEQGLVRVTVQRQARSFLLKSWDRTASWYDVSVSATGTRGGSR